ncbi:hypothetical protein VNO77_25100 [Canavalia gladiata]|uniref:Uncharacterized protein n=1 Tax=Canavalia gladiata TaxID=3824 RepID=A0AAN9LAW9_CANGL
MICAFPNASCFIVYLIEFTPDLVPLAFIGRKLHCQVSFMNWHSAPIIYLKAWCIVREMLKLACCSGAYGLSRQKHSLTTRLCLKPHLNHCYASRRDGDCLVLPFSLIRRRSMGYRPLTKDKESHNPVTVVVGKEKRVFLVDPFILQENPFRVLMDTSMKKDSRDKVHLHQHRVVFVDVDAILFEHMLWLMHNDCSSLFKLNLKEIIDFYAQDM